jgi:alpha,alpha-trehalase
MSEWLLVLEGWDPQDEGRREALCTLGNGYFATRGAAPESHAGGPHYPGTYIAGVYNRLGSEIAGRWVENESLVNVPNWLPLKLRIEGGEWLDDSTAEILSHRLELDMRQGVLVRRTRLADSEGRVLRLTQRRFVSMRDPHVAALQTTVVHENFSGRLEVLSALDGTVVNSGVQRYADLPNQHLRPLRTHQENDEVVCLHTETTQSHIRIAQAARTQVRVDGEAVATERTLVEETGYVGQVLGVDVTEGCEVVVDKVVTVFTSRDPAISEPGVEACDLVCNVLAGFDELLGRHAVAWRHLWDRAEIALGTDGEVGLLLHLHQFHALQTVSLHSASLDVGVPARGLHGEAYRGHIFWDELFICPFFSLRFPELTRAILMYRHRRLERARRAAVEEGHEGAMYPWQSSSNGREETQTMHLNPISGRWLPDASQLQRHVNAAIAYNTWHYYQATGDEEFLRFYGAEMILEIARFWAGLATYNHSEDRYEIRGVMGPDEYHEGYPDRDRPGLDNNAYTNVMAVWCLCRALELLSTVPEATAQELTERLVITPAERQHWADVIAKMRLVFHDGVISQFEGYDQLLELDWEHYRERYGDISRTDRILEAEGDSTDRYQVTKQADVSMLFYLFTAEELEELLERMGYGYDKELIPRTIEYYERRTAHGSTLSRVVHSWVHARRDRERSWHLFRDALRSDVDDIQGGTTAEGIHLGAMAGTIDLIQRCYTGLELRRDVLRLNPSIPDELGTLAFAVRYRGRAVRLEFTKTSARVSVDPVGARPIVVDCKGETVEIAPGAAYEFRLDQPDDPKAGGSSAGP